MTALVRLTALRPRLVASLAAAVVLFVALPHDRSLPLRLVLAWDFGAALYLVLILAMAARATPEGLRTRARAEDERAWVILLIMVGAALVSLLAILWVLRDAKSLPGWDPAVHSALAGATILLSWGTTHVMFAIHYAHGFYDDPEPGPQPAGAPRGGLAFPGEEQPDYWDFLYFSFVIGMTCQVSDVQVIGRAMRRLALLHGIVAFLFNTVILALSINIMAGLL